LGERPFHPDSRRRARGGRDPRRGDRRDRSQGRRLAEPLRDDREQLREPRRDRPPLPDRPPARVRGHLDRAARRGGRRGHPRPPRAGTRLVLGPAVTWYLAVSAVLFATGALGVLLRRSPLIVLLSLEIMLNGANLALIAFARHWARGD